MCEIFVTHLTYFFICHTKETISFIVTVTVIVAVTVIVVVIILHLRERLTRIKLLLLGNVQSIIRDLV